MKSSQTILLLAAAASIVISCSDSTKPIVATAPSTTSSVGAGSSALTAGTIGFSLLPVNDAPVTSYSESGFQVSMLSGDWRRMSYGNPAPAPQFWAEAGASVTGELRVTPSSPTYFKSIDLYSSTTSIPYVIVGLRSGSPVFTLSGNTGNTFGTFRTVSNPNAVLVDALSVKLTNTAAACCRNPMGVDNIAFTETPAAAPVVYSLSGSVTDSATGAAIPGASVTIESGPDKGRSATAGSNGAFSFPALQEGSFSVAASAANYPALSKTVSLASNQSVSFALTRDPKTLPTPAPAGATVIGFDAITNGAALNSYTESGVTVSGESWSGNTSYGHPAPFIQFYAEAGTSVTREITLTAGGSPFSFAFAELYSSTTRIPYTITGRRNGAVVFTLTGEVPNTFGTFKAVQSSNNSSIDSLTIAVTNTVAAGCCRNPMGIDTIAIIK